MAQKRVCLTCKNMRVRGPHAASPNWNQRRRYGQPAKENRNDQTFTAAHLIQATGWPMLPEPDGRSFPARENGWEQRRPATGARPTPAGQLFVENSGRSEQLMC